MKLSEFLTEKRWAKGIFVNFYVKSSGDVIPILIEEATDDCYFCLSGAIAYLKYKYANKESYYTNIRKIIINIIGNIPDWNNAEETKFKDVLEVILKAEKIIESRDFGSNV